MGMTKQLRYTVLTTALVFTGMVVLIFIGLNISLKNLRLQEEQKNLAVSHALTYAYGEEISRLLERGLGDGSRFEAAIQDQLQTTSSLKINLFDSKGVTIYSTDKTAVGEVEASNENLQKALTGQRASEYETFDVMRGDQTETRRVTAIYLPVYADALKTKTDTGKVVGVFEIYSDVTSQVRSLYLTQLGFGLVATFMVVFIVGGIYYLTRRSSRTLQAHQDELERYAHLVRQTPTSLLEVTRAGEIVFLNPSAKKRFAELDNTTSQVEALAHPLLTAWESITTHLQPGAIFERELHLADSVFMQRISFNDQSQNYDMYIHDVTTQKRSEANLIRVQREQRAILDAIPDMMFISDKDGILLECKIDAKHQELEQLLGHNFQDLGIVPDDIAKQFDKVGRQALQTQQPQQLEYSLVNKTGEESYYEARVVPLGSERIMSLVRDVTERKVQELALEKSEAKTRSLVSAFPDLIFIVDKEGRCLEMQLDEEHPLLEPLIGRTFHEISFIPTKVADMLAEKIRLALETRTMQVAEYELTSESDRNDFEARFVALDDERVLYIARDISDRKRQDLALRESEARTRSLLSAFPDLIFVMDKTGTFLEAQLDEEHPLLEPLVGRNVSEISFVPEETAQLIKGYVRRAIATKELQIAEYNLPSLGRYSDYEARFVALDDERVLYIARDVTERKRRELDLRASEAQIRSLLEAIPDMVFVMSRDGRYLDFKLDKTHGLIEELTGRSVRELSFVPPGIAESILTKLEQASKTNETQTLEYTLDGNIDGVRRLAHYEARFTKIDEEKVLMFVRDVTKRYENEWALQASEAQVRSLLEAIPDMVFVMNKEGTYLDYKLDKDHKVLEELVGQNVRDLNFMSAEVAQALLDKLGLASMTREVQTLEYSLQGYFGSEHRLTHYEARFAPIDHEKILMLVRDVSQRHADEVSLQTLTQEAQRRAQELLLLDKVRTVAVQEQGLTQVIRQTVNVIAETFDYTLVSIYLLEDTDAATGPNLVLQHQVGYQTFIERLPITKGVMGKVARTGQAVLLKSPKDDPDVVWAFEGINSEICVPLLDSGKVVGVLNLESTEQRFFDEADFRLMTALSETLGVAIERARLYQEVKASEQTYRDLYALSEQQAQSLARRADELALLDNVRSATMNAPSIETLYHTVVEAVVEHLGYQNAFLYQVKDNTFVLAHQLGYDIEVKTLPLHEGLCGRAYRSAKPLLVTNAASDPDHVHLQPNVVSGIYVPFLQGEVVRGVLAVETTKRDRFSLNQGDLSLLSSLADFISIAITRTALFEEAKENEARYRDLYTVAQTQSQELARRTKELELLEQIRTMIASKLEPASLFKSVTEAVSQVLGYKYVNIATVKGDALEIYHHVGFETYAQERGSLHLNINQGITGRVARTGQAAFVPDVSVDPDYYAGPSSTIISEICVPIFERGKVTSIINVESEETLSSAHFETLQQIADYVGLALEQAELYQALQHSEVRYRELIENATDIIYRIDLTGKFTYTNAVVKRIMGYEEHEVLGMHYLDLVRSDERANVQAFYIQQLQSSQASSYLEFPAIARDGREVWLGQSVGLVKDNGKIVSMQAVARDITERKRMEEALVQQAEELSSANADLEQFAFIAAHDLQEPLRKIQAFGDRLSLKYKDVLDEQGRDYLERMRGSATRMRTLIDDLLSFARANKQQERKIISLEPIIQAVVSDLQVLVEETQATISVGTLPTLELDPSQFRQVFQNVLGNALKFRKPDVPPVITVYSHRLYTGEWQIRISDNGIGFDEQYKERIFAVFQRLHSRDQYEGTGIGLAIVRRIIEGHGGSIEVTSRLGEGSTFYITLPGVAKIRTEDNQEAVLA